MDDESILVTIKKMIGLPEEYEQFDTDIITHINTTFMILNQLGVGPSKGFRISDKTTTGSEYLPEGSDLEGVKSYIHLNVKLLFDPPQNATLMDSINRQINMLEFRLAVNADKGEEV